MTVVSIARLRLLSVFQLVRFRKKTPIAKANCYLSISLLCLLVACGVSGNNGKQSPTTSTQTAASPTFTPATGASFATTLSVSIADSTSGATVYYTTDGSMPTTSSKTYAGPFTINATTTINAIAAEARQHNKCCSFSYLHLDTWPDNSSHTDLYAGRGRGFCYNTERIYR